MAMVGVVCLVDGRGQCRNKHALDSSKGLDSELGNCILLVHQSLCAEAILEDYGVGRENGSVMLLLLPLDWHRSDP